MSREARLEIEADLAIQRAVATADKRVARGTLDGVSAAELESEAEAADIRRTEFATLAQSKMGKQAQIEELTARAEKEKHSAAMIRERLEAALVEEQQVLSQWTRLDEELQQAEVDRARLLATKVKEKEIALEKAQIGESSLEELKDTCVEITLGTVSRRI